MQLIPHISIMIRKYTLSHSFLLIFMLSLSSMSFAQRPSPVKWEYTVVKAGGSEYELKATALIDKQWHLYGQFFDDGGPIKLTFNFETAPNYELIGKTVESPQPIMERDEIFEINVSYFTENAVFTQKVKTINPGNIKLIIRGQVCNEQSGICVPVDDEHVFSIE
jgi:hypothetical protein